MALGKWFIGALGLMHGGILGGIAGFVLGALFEYITDTGSQESTKEEESTIDNASRNRFLFSLMVISAHIIKADGRIMHSEMEYVRRFLIHNFGEEAKDEGNEILMRIFEYRKLQGEEKWQNDIIEACNEIRMMMPIEHRLQLISMLVEIAKADGELTSSEYDAIRHIANILGISDDTINQLMSLGKNTLADAYKVFGVEPTATNEEIRKKYRKLALQYHPDRVATLGNDIKENAKRKFQELNEAKEIIWKERGMV